MQQGYIVLPNNQSLHYQQRGIEYLGKNPSLIFIHGNFSNSFWWHDTIEGLQHLKRHIIAIELRGFGKSSYKIPCNRFGAWADDVRQFCKIRGVEKCVVNGWSFGGGVSMKLAEIAPQLVQKIILTCSVSHQGLKMITNKKPCISRQQIMDNQKAKLMIEFLETKNVQKMKQIYQIMLFTHSKNYPIEKKQMYVLACFEQRCYIELLQALANSDIDISKIKAQCLMIHGKQDQVVVLDSVKSTGEYFKNFIVWEDNAHMIPIQNPKGYEALIENFIQSK